MNGCTEDDEEKSSEDSKFITALCCEIIADVIQGMDDVSDLEEKYCDSSDHESINCKNEENGFYHVKNMMTMWNKLSELQNWCFHIQYINKLISNSMDYCAYEVKWAKPLEGFTYPIITANVYVFIKIGKNEKSGTSIDIKYVFEGNRFVHNSRMQFNPKWLNNAYENKKSVIQAVACKKCYGL